MALAFDISSTNSCSKLRFTNNSVLCVPTGYSFDYLVASINPPNVLGGGVIEFQAHTESTETIVSYAWTLNTGGAKTTSTAVYTMTANTTNVVQLVVTTVTFTSTVEMKVRTDASNNVSWIVSPNVDFTNSTDNSADKDAYFTDTTYNYNATLDATQNNFTIGATNRTGSTALPYNHTYPSAATYNLTWVVQEDALNVNTTLAAQFKVTEEDNDCTGDITNTIESATLYIKLGDGAYEAVDITSQFFNDPFYITVSDLDLGTLTDGIYEFRLVVVNDDGNDVIKCIKKPLICNINCTFASLLHDISQADACCTNCEEEDKKKALTILVYKAAIDNAYACQNWTEVQNLIDFLTRLVAQDDCNGCN